MIPALPRFYCAVSIVRIQNSFNQDWDFTICSQPTDVFPGQGWFHNVIENPELSTDIAG